MTERFSYDDWFRQKPRAFGRAVVALLAPDEQVARAVAVLDLCRSKWPAVSAVERVSQIGRARDRWPEGHEAFDAVRTLTLREEAMRTSDVYYTLLFVAEIAAKIIYNASGKPAPFDDDSPDWLAPNARDFVEALGEHSFGLLVWNALTGMPRSP